MDANGQQFWLAHGGNAWREPYAAEVAAWPGADGVLDEDSRRVAIGSLSALTDYGESRPGPRKLEELRDRIPMTADTLGGRAWYDKKKDAVLALNHAYDGDETEPPRAPRVIFPLKRTPTDLALGHDGLLHIAVDGKIIIADIRGRRETVKAGRSGFRAWRMAIGGNGEVWALELDGRVARLEGVPPFRGLTAGGKPAHEFRSVPPPPKITLVPTSLRVPMGEIAAAIAAQPGGGVSVLSWTDNLPTLRVLTPAGRVVVATLGKLKRPFSIAWLDARRFVVLAPGVKEAVAYEFDDEAFQNPAQGTNPTLEPLGDYFPLPSHDGGPFVHALGGELEYSAGADARRPEVIHTRPLLVMALANFDTTARAVLRAPLDSGRAGTEWSRLYVDALIPPETGFTILAAATDTPDAKPAETEFFPHHFGGVPGATRTEPRAAWVPEPSEFPGHPGFIPHEHGHEHGGLFTVLLQRGGAKGRRTRSLRGRWLHLRLVLRGNGRATPCVHSLRAWGPRFSYAAKYLPELYREQVFGTDADAEKPATREDFLARMLANFEGMLTPIEDSIAAAWRLTDPRTAPDEALPWLARWIGVSFQSWFPAARRRAWLRCAPELFKRRGTVRGLELALEIATNGGVSTGRVVVIEEFRMRRTFGTLLGVRMDREHDDLLGGPVVSGNSKVGRTLIISDTIKREVFALFNVEKRPRDADAVRQFFAALAHRVTILVHDALSQAELDLIKLVATRESPAHVVVKVRTASGSFITGLTSLLGVDTFIRPPRAPESVTLDDSAVGGGALLFPPPSLDPRFA